MIYRVKNNGGTKELEPLAGMTPQGLPLGSLISAYDNTTITSDYLVANGNTFDTSRYPSLAILLGGNVLPEVFDHSRPSDYESITLSTSEANPTVMQYDGVLEVNTTGSSSKSVVVNGTQITAGTANNMGISYNIDVRKGDSVYANGSVSSCYARFYKSHKLIKATDAADTYTPPSSEMSTIEAYFDQGFSKATSYSTNETLTGGTWIDGKPIYRKVCILSGETTISTSGTNFSLSTLGLSNIDNIIMGLAFNDEGDKSSTSKRRFSPLTIIWDSSDVNVKLAISANFTSYYTKILFEYTKI